MPILEQTMGETSVILELTNKQIIERFAKSGTSCVTDCYVNGKAVYVTTSSEGVNEIVFESEEDASKFDRMLRLTADGVQWYVSTGYIYRSKENVVGSRVAFPSFDTVEINGVEYQIASMYDNRITLGRNECGGPQGEVTVTVDPVSVVVGATILFVQGLTQNSPSVTITTDRGVLKLGHVQKCCEQVFLLDFNGDERELVGRVIRTAEVSIVNDEVTFYRFRTDGDDLDLRFGDSDNSMYGEEVTVVWTGKYWPNRDKFQPKHD